ncbi:hypothetical protein ACU686_12460 [Yinghuangia aomiensis]
MGPLRPLDTGISTASAGSSPRHCVTCSACLVCPSAATAQQRFRDAGSISPFLSGTRVPPWQFVVDLLDDVTACQGHLVPPADVARLLRLHRAAVRSGSAAARPVQVLELQLAEAELDARRSTVEEEVIGDALIDRSHRVAELETRLSRL